MTGNIYLVGFMGAGKSTVGRLLAQKLNRRFVDMDEALVKRFGAPIHQVFAEKGEPAFRSAESALLRKIARKALLVVAAGGGVVMEQGNLELMKSSGTLVHLAVRLETSAARIDDAEKAIRPMWKDPQAAAELYERRKPVYDRSDFVLKSDDVAPEEIAGAIVSRLAGDEHFSVNMGGAERSVICTWNAPETLAPHGNGRRTVILTDRIVSRLHKERFLKVLPHASVIELPAGERTKTLDGARRVYRALLNGRYERGDLLVALGGGVITDMGGFVSSTYKRGMHFIPVSTTLLGCVDAAVGGKTAVNLGEAKNVVGTFTVPEAVILDFAALRTLGQKQVREGLVEAYKTGLVASVPLARLVSEHVKELLAGDQLLLARAAAMSAGAKAEVVSGDFREAGRRRILNLGHTYGHAYEGFHRFRVTHGNGVAVGMEVAVRISEQRKLVTKEFADSVAGVIRLLSPRRAPLPSAAEAWNIMMHDKKVVGGKVVFVLPEGEGQSICVDDVTPAELETAVEKVREEFHG